MIGGYADFGRDLRAAARRRSPPWAAGAAVTVGGEGLMAAVAQPQLPSVPADRGDPGARARRARCGSTTAAIRARRRPLAADGGRGDRVRDVSGCLEHYDAPDLSLPSGQDEVIRAVAAANPEHLVVLRNRRAGAHAVARPRAPAVVAAWYPGQEGGAAIGNVLFGVAEPAGGLPVTFPKREADLPRPSHRSPPCSRPPSLHGSPEVAEAGAEVVEAGAEALLKCRRCRRR